MFKYIVKFCSIAIFGILIPEFAMLYYNKYLVEINIKYDYFQFTFQKIMSAIMLLSSIALVYFSRAFLKKELTRFQRVTGIILLVISILLLIFSAGMALITFSSPLSIGF